MNDAIFETHRLRVAKWHAAGDDLVGIVSTIMSPATTRHLPPEWAGDYDGDRARRWIADRDEEGTTLLARERCDARAVGLLFAHETGHTEVDIRLGYVIAESAWGQGLATELVEGFVGWCRSAEVATITAGVATDNRASVRVLEKTGFRLIDGAAGSELVYRHSLSADVD